MTFSFFPSAMLTSSKVEINLAFIMKHPELDIVYMTRKKTEVITKDGSEVLLGKLDT